MPIGSMSRAAHTVTEPFTQDPLSAMAPLLRVRPELQDLCRFASQWDTVHEAEPPGWAQFHIVTKGRFLLERYGGGAPRPAARHPPLAPARRGPPLRAPPPPPRSRTARASRNNNTGRTPDKTG